MQGDGNFCLYTAANVGYYCTYTNGKGIGPYYKLVMQNDRNICIYDSFDRFIWGSNTGRVADTLLNGQNLTPGQQLISANGQWKLVYQDDGDLAAYATVDNSFIWKVGVKNASPGTAAMQGDGNFCLYTAANVGYYCTYTNGKGIGPYYKLVMQNDRNICIYNSFDRFIWGSNTGPK